MKTKFTILLCFISFLSFSQNSNVVWKKVFYSSVFANVKSIHEVSGLLVVNASFQGSLNFASKTYTSTTIANIILIYDTSGIEKNAIKIEGTIVDFKIKIDHLSNIILYGTFGTFGGGYITFKGNNISAIGNHDYFIAKIDLAGNHHWIQPFVSKNDEELIYGIDIDDNSNIYAVGYYGDSISFKSGIKLTYSNTFGRNGFIVKLDTSGNVVRANQGIPISSSGIANLLSVIVQNNRIYCLGTINSITKVGADTIKSVSSSLLPLWLYTLDTACNFTSIKTIGTLSRPNGSLNFSNINTEIIQNSLFITSGFKDKLNFGTTPLTSSVLNFTPFISKVSTNGQNILSKQFTTSNDGSGVNYDIKKQPNGSLAVLGGFSSSTNLIEGVSYPNKGSEDAYLIEYDSSLVIKSIKFFATPSADLLVMPILNFNESYYSGMTWPINNKIIFGIDTIVTSNNNQQSFIIKYSHPFTINPPTNLMATSFSQNKINLTWNDNSNNEEQFIIQRSINDTNSFVTIDSVNANIVTYENSGLSPGMKCYYRIYAQVPNIKSGFSNYATATTKIGIDNSKTTMNLTIFPNPFENELAIKSSGIIEGYSIYNMQGKLILNRKIEHKNEIEINTKAIPEGMYILQVRDEKGIIQRRIVVKL